MEASPKELLDGEFLFEQQALAEARMAIALTLAAQHVAAGAEQAELEESPDGAEVLRREIAAVEEKLAERRREVMSTTSRRISAPTPQSRELFEARRPASARTTPVGKDAFGNGVSSPNGCHDDNDDSRLHLKGTHMP